MKNAGSVHGTTEEALKWIMGDIVANLQHQNATNLHCVCHSLNTLHGTLYLNKAMQAIKLWYGVSPNRELSFTYQQLIKIMSLHNPPAIMMHLWTSFTVAHFGLLHYSHFVILNQVMSDTASNLHTGCHTIPQGCLPPAHVSTLSLVCPHVMSASPGSRDPSFWIFFSNLPSKPYQTSICFTCKGHLCKLGVTASHYCGLSFRIRGATRTAVGSLIKPFITVLSGPVTIFTLVYPIYQLIYL